jgi:hypothetical protein
MMPHLLDGSLGSIELEKSDCSGYGQRNERDSQKQKNQSAPHRAEEAYLSFIFRG